MSKSLTFLSDTDWKHILTDWRAREANHWGWEAHWKQRGFQSWDAWREQFYTKLDLPNKSWTLHELTDPNEFTPNMWPLRTMVGATITRKESPAQHFQILHAIPIFLKTKKLLTY